MAARNARVKQRRRLSLRGLIVLVLLVALFVLALAMGWIRFSEPTGALQELEYMSASSPYSYTGSGFVYMGGSTLLHKDFKDKAEWNVALFSSDVKLASSSEITAVYNNVALQALSTRTGASLFPNVEFTGTIVAVRCSKNYIAVLKKDTRNVHTLYLYDAKGNRLDSFTLGDNAVLDFGFYGEAERFWTLALNTSGVSPISTITTFNTGQSNTGIMPIEGQIVDKVYFNGENTLYAACTNYLMAFDGVGKETSRRLIYGWKVLDYSLVSSKPYFLLVPRKESGATVTSNIAKLVTVPEGAQDAFINLPTGSLGVFLMNGKIVVPTAGALYYYSIKGELTSEKPLSVAVENAYKLDNTRLLLTQGAHAYLVAIG